MTEKHDPNVMRPELSPLIALTTQFAQRSKHGEICWVEIPVYDVSRAQKLYKDLFGWEYTPEPAPQHNPGIENLHFFTKGGVHGAFLHVKEGYNVTQYGKLDKEVLPPLMTFCVKDCEEALVKAKAHGGKVQW